MTDFPKVFRKKVLLDLTVSAMKKKMYINVYNTREDLSGMQ